MVLETTFFLGDAAGELLRAALGRPWRDETLRDGCFTPRGEAGLLALLPRVLGRVGVVERFGGIPSYLVWYRVQWW